MQDLHWKAKIAAAAIVAGIRKLITELFQRPLRIRRRPVCWVWKSP